MIDLRTALGAVAVARDVVRVAGPDALSYLQGQLSQDVVDDFDVGATNWAFVLQPTGKVDALVRATRTQGDEVVLDVDAGAGEALLTRLRRFLLRTKADVDLLDWSVVALRGPGATAAARDVVQDGADGVLAVPALWPDVDGADLLGPGVTVASLALPEGVAAAEPDDLLSLRVRAGVPAMGAELTADTIPAEAGQWLIDAAVSFTKGCFTGQELVARIDSRGGNVPRRVRGLVIAGDAAPEPGTAVTVGGAEVGRVTSVAPAPGGGHVALAIVARAIVPPADAEVVVASGTVPARVAELPLDG